MYIYMCVFNGCPLNGLSTSTLKNTPGEIGFSETWLYHPIPQMAISCCVNIRKWMIIVWIFVADFTILSYKTISNHIEKHIKVK